jgi:hypothetical protein
VTSHDGGDWNGCPNCGGTRGTTGDTIERIARAIHAVRAALIFAWDDETESVRDLFRGYARAAVAAMPNPGPQRAVDGGSGGGGIDGTSDEASEVYSVTEIRAAFANHASKDDWGVPAFYDSGLIAALRGEYDDPAAARSGGTR